MKANETPLQPIMVRADQQFIVPLFQRPYSWDKKEWQELWDDLLELSEPDEHGKGHFLGSIVTIPEASGPQGIAKFTLIDGQQRLTTLFILLMLIRDLTSSQSLAQKIEEQQLVNKFAGGDDYYKLLPTQQDRPAFQVLIRRQQPIAPELENTQIIKCYRFFEKHLKKIELEKLSRIISHQLTVVSIVLDRDENPHLVFESLNARGKPLTQADLIRNYFFMRIASDKQEDIFDRYWRPMQETLGDSLTECMRHYLMARKASFVKTTEVYIALKNWIEDTKTDILNSLQEIATYADYYQKILSPEREYTANIQRALQRIKRIEVTVAYPFLLRCYHDYAQHVLSEEDFGKILHLVENLVIRLAVCNLPSHGLNKIFPTVYDKTQSNSPQEFVNNVVRLLQGKGYPNDEKFKDALTTNNFYSRSEGRERTKLILESLESAYQHKEQVDFKELSVEHIMPQTIKSSVWWQRHLGDEWETVHELHLHTLGNLTLTNYNSEMSNKSFPEKQRVLVNSHLELNRYFASISEWREEQIKQRAEKLAELALKVWPSFGDQSQAVSRQKHEVTGARPSRLMIKHQEVVVKTWRDVLDQTLKFLANENAELFEKLAAEYPRFVSNKIGLSAERVYRFCQQAMEYFGYSKEDWQVDYQ